MTTHFSGGSMCGAVLTNARPIRLLWPVALMTRVGIGPKQTSTQPAQPRDYMNPAAGVIFIGHAPSRADWPSSRVLS
jgi:hypothetical protein